MTASSTRPEATVLDVQSAILELRKLASGRVLSVYLDTSPSRIDGKKYLLRFYRDVFARSGLVRQVRRRLHSRRWRRASTTT